MNNKIKQIKKIKQAQHMNSSSSQKKGKLRGSNKQINKLKREIKRQNPNHYLGEILKQQKSQQLT